MSSIVIIEIGVTSEPVPAVVGISTSGILGPFALLTPHIVSIFWLDPRSKDISFATSIDEPPPKPKTPVDLKAVASSNAFNKVDFEGSDSTLLNIFIFEYDWSFLIVLSYNPNSVNPSSVITKMFFPNKFTIWSVELTAVSLPKIKLAVEWKLNIYLWSGRKDSNLRPPGPKPGALPGCATPRKNLLYS